MNNIYNPLKPFKKDGRRKNNKTELTLIKTNRKTHKYLTAKEKRYIYFRARNYPHIDCIEKAGYCASSRVNAYNMSQEMEKKPFIYEQIVKERLSLAERNLNLEQFVIDGLTEIAERSKQDANKARAYELLGKTKAMFTEKLETTGTMKVTTNQEKEVTRVRDEIFADN